MGLSAPWANSIDIIDLKPVKKWPGINPMVHSDSWDDSIDIIAYQTAKINR